MLFRSVREVLAGADGWRQLSIAEVLKELRAEGRLTGEGQALLAACETPEGALLLLPGALGREHATDGFFMAMLERTPSS